MYNKALSHLNNVTISNRFSPRQSGEIEARSNWKEIKSLPASLAERIALVEKLSVENAEVHLKTATTYGRARLFVKAS
jgi:undecaprenyl pyrophosphate synthase